MLWRSTRSHLQVARVVEWHAMLLRGLTSECVRCLVPPHSMLCAATEKCCLSARVNMATRSHAAKNVFQLGELTFSSDFCSGNMGEAKKLGKGAGSN